MLRAFAFCLAAATVPTASLGFEIDIPVGEFMDRTHEVTLARAAVGDTVRIDTEYLCHRDGALWVWENAPIHDGSDLHWLGRIEPDRTIALESRDGARAADAYDLLDEIEVVLLWQHCRDYVLTEFADSREFFRVMRVNDRSSLTSLIEDMQ